MAGRGTGTAEGGRLEDARFLTGQGRYLDDLAPEGLLHGVVVRAPHAEARIAGLDAGPAAAMPGVHLVLTAADLEAAGIGPIPVEFAPKGFAPADFADRAQPVLAGDRVRFAGEPVAFVVAETLAQALDAAEAVEIDWEELPPRPPLEDPGAEVIFTLERGDAAACAAGFAGAAQVVEAVLPVPRVHALALEPRSALGAYDPERGFTLQTGTQRVHLVQRALADRVLGVPRDRVRVISPDTGGGFGPKNALYPEPVLCLLAAQRTGRPVKWVSTRSEAMLADNHGRGNLFRIAAALGPDGRLRAIRARRRVDLGAYVAPRAMVPVENGLDHLTGVYRVAAAHAVVEGVATAAAPTCPYRGAGRPENVFACERLIDMAARRLGMEPIALRRANLLTAAEMPWRSPLGTPFAGVDPAAALEQALARVDHAGFPARREAAKAEGLLAGLGVALFAEALHGAAEPAPARLVREGTGLRLSVASGSTGHGHETTFRRLAAARLGLAVERIGFVQSDTAVIPDGPGTAASWSTTLSGSSVALAADAAVARARGVAAGLLGAAVKDIRLDDGLFRGPGNRSCGWDDVLAADPEFAAEGAFTGSGETVSVGCHACEVTVDPETGAIALTRAVVVQDCGRALEPVILQGMLHGGFAQGVGQGWMEAIRHDATGQLLTGGLTDYALPRAADLPALQAATLASEEPSNPLGVKGIGESAATGGTAGFVNAVMDALAPLGIHDIPLPLSPGRVFAAIAGARP